MQSVGRHALYTPPYFLVSMALRPTQPCFCRSSALPTIQVRGGPGSLRIRHCQAGRSPYTARACALGQLQVCVRTHVCAGLSLRESSQACSAEMCSSCGVGPPPEGPQPAVRAAQGPAERQGKKPRPSPPPAPARRGSPACLPWSLAPGPLLSPCRGHTRRAVTAPAWPG